MSEFNTSAKQSAPERIWLSSPYDGVNRDTTVHEHKHFDDDMKYVRVDPPPDCPSEQEAEAILREAGTSGREVVNEFIERLLKENSALKSRLARVSGEVGTGEAHPEDYCHRCGRPNIVWFGPNEIWNKSVRAINEKEILCPVCFVELAGQAGFTGVWEVAPQGFHAGEIERAVNKAMGIINRALDVASTPAVAGPTEEAQRRLDVYIRSGGRIEALVASTPSTPDTEDKCARCNGTGEVEGYGGNNIYCGHCSGTGKNFMGQVALEATPSGVREAAREIVEMIEAEREPHPEWSKNARRKYRDKAAEIISKHVVVPREDAERPRAIFDAGFASQQRVGERCVNCGHNNVNADGRCKEVIGSNDTGRDAEPFPTTTICWCRCVFQSSPKESEEPK